MDQKRIGGFIAQLRRERGWTQEALGSRLGVTNKTVSRWENGNYMPDIEMLSLLGRELEVSLNELVQGRRLEEETDFREAAEENLSSALERPAVRAWRWLEGHLLSVTVIFLLCLSLITAAVLYSDYRNANPADVPIPGSYVSITPAGWWDVHLVFDQYGNHFCRYQQWEGVLEVGTYTQHGEFVEVTTEEGFTYQLLIKGNSLYQEDGGEFRSYTKFDDFPVFICCPCPWWDN